MGRVRIGTCTGPSDAALVRAAFEAHKIRFVINAEQHASMLAGLGGAFVPLHVYVDEEDAEEASELLADLQNTHDDGELAAQAEAAAQDSGAEPPEDDEEDSPNHVGERVMRRRRTGVVLLLAMCVTFGTAHMYAGAWLRGFILAIVEIFAITQTIGNPKLGVVVLIGCIVTDLVGALWLVKPRTNVPTARVVR